MSTIVLVEQTPASIATPTSGKVRIGVDLTGNLFSKDDAGAVTIYGAGLTSEQVQDIVGGMLSSTASIDATYDDSGNLISFDVLEGGVDHDLLANFVANEHIDHSAIAINAGPGLTGGGDLTTTRTISMPNVGTPGSYGSATAVPVITTDAQGRVSGVTLASITPAGIGAQPLDADLTALAALVGTGFLVRTGAGTAVNRSIAVGASLSIADGDGISGNPTISMPNVGTPGSYGSATSVPVITTDAQGRVSGVTLASITPAGIGAQPLDADLTAISALTGTGLITRTGTGTAITRSIAVGAGLSIADGDGVAGNPTVSMPNVGTAGTYGTPSAYPIITTDAQGRVISVSTASVSAVFGSEAEDFTDLTTATTTAVAFNTGASFVTATKPVGRYRIGFFFNWSINVNNADARFRLMVNGVQQGPECRVELSETSAQSNFESGFVYYDVGSEQTLTIDIDFASETNGNTVSLFQTRVEIWRVS